MTSSMSLEPLIREGVRFDIDANNNVIILSQPPDELDTADSLHSQPPLSHPTPPTPPPPQRSDSVDASKLQSSSGKLFTTPLVSPVPHRNESLRKLFPCLYHTVTFFS